MLIMKQSITRPEVIAPSLDKNLMIFVIIFLIFFLMKLDFTFRKMQILFLFYSDIF